MSIELEKFRKNEIRKAKTRIHLYRLLAGSGILLVILMKPFVVALPIFIGMFSILASFAVLLILRTKDWSTWKQRCEEGLSLDCRKSLVASIEDGFLCLRLPDFPDRILYSTKLPSSLVSKFNNLLGDRREVFGYISTSWPAPVAVEIDKKFIALSPWFEKNILRELQDSRILDTLEFDGNSKCDVA